MMTTKRLSIWTKQFLRFMQIITVMAQMYRSRVDARLLDTSVACDQLNFILSLNFDSSFRGLVYSEEGFPNCIYVNGTMLSHLNYQLKIPLHGCETKINGDGNFENGIIIQENVAFLQATDKKYLLTCIPSSHPPPNSFASPPSASPPTSTEQIPPSTFPPPPPGPVQTPPAAFDRENSVTVDFGGVTVDQSLASTELIRGTLPPSLPADGGSVGPSPPLPELKYSVEIRAGHSLDSTPINAALNIGDPISYVVRLQRPISESQIGRCWASDSKSSLELSDEHGCSLQPRGNIWGPFERVESPNELIFVNKIKAWAFPTSNEVNIFCNLRVCMSRHCSFAANCSAEIDHQNQQKNGRRRREGGGFEEIETLRAKIRLRRQNGGQTVESGGGQSAAEKFSSLLYCPYALEEGGDMATSTSSSFWCLSFGQLAMVIACCCIASICLTLASSFLIHAHCFRSAEPIWWFGKSFNGKKNQQPPPIVDDVWQMIAELRSRNALAKRRRDETKKGNDQMRRVGNSFATGEDNNDDNENYAHQYAV